MCIISPGHDEPGTCKLFYDWANWISIVETQKDHDMWQNQSLSFTFVNSNLTFRRRVLSPVFSGKLGLASVQAQCLSNSTEGVSNHRFFREKSIFASECLDPAPAGLNVHSDGIRTTEIIQYLQVERTKLPEIFVALMEIDGQDSYNEPDVKYWLHQ
jgi:hypothetical protein